MDYEDFVVQGKTKAFQDHNKYDSRISTTRLIFLTAVDVSHMAANTIKSSLHKADER
jgi:hypothetical protein